MVLGLNPVAADTDNNGTPDGDEDPDGDQLTHLEELVHGTEPNLDDTDGDRLLDGEEVVLGTDPLLADSDSDGIFDGDEVDMGMDPLLADSDGNGVDDGDEPIEGTKELEPVVAEVLEAAPTITVESDAGNIVTLHMEMDMHPMLNDDIPGFVEHGVDLTIDEAFEEATLTFEIDPELMASEGFVPAIYYFNEETQRLEELPNQVVNGNTISANLDHFSRYITLNKTVYEAAWQDSFKVDQNADLTTDSNNDGISDYFTRKIIDNDLVTGTGQILFKGLTYEQVQNNMDYDGDGLKNGEEIMVSYDGEIPYIEVISDPMSMDTDQDGTDDYDELIKYKTNPLRQNAVIHEPTLEKVLQDDWYIAGAYSDGVEGNLAQQVGIFIGTHVFSDEHSKRSTYKGVLLEYFESINEEIYEENRMMANAELILGYAEGIAGILEKGADYVDGANDVVIWLDSVRGAASEFSRTHSSIAYQNLVTYSGHLNEAVRNLDHNHKLVAFMNSHHFKLNFHLCKDLNKGLKTFGYVMIGVNAGFSIKDEFDAAAKIQANYSTMMENAYILKVIEVYTDDPVLADAARELRAIIESEVNADVYRTANAINAGIMSVSDSLVNMGIGSLLPGFGIGKFISNLTFKVGENAKVATELITAAEMSSCLSQELQNVSDRHYRTTFEGTRYVVAHEASGNTLIKRFNNLVYARTYGEEKAVQFIELPNAVIEWFEKVFTNKAEAKELANAKLDILSIWEDLYETYTLDPPILEDVVVLQEDGGPDDDTPPADRVVVYEDDFEAYALNTLPDQWIIKYNGSGNGNQGIRSGNGGQVLQIDGATNWSGVLRKDLPSMPDQVRFSYDVYGFENGSVMIGNGSKYTGMGIANAGLDAWHHFDLDVDFVNETVEVYINGEYFNTYNQLGVQDPNKSWSPFGTAPCIVIDTGNRSNSHKIHIDNLMITTDDGTQNPDPDPQPNLKPIKDTYADPHNPDDNYGSRTQFSIANHEVANYFYRSFVHTGGMHVLGDTQKKYLKLTPVGSHKYGNPDGYPDNNYATKIAVYAVTSSWDEMTLTYNTMPTVESTPLQIIDTVFPNVTGDQTIMIDLTEVNNRWLNGDLANNGIMIVGYETFQDPWYINSFVSTDNTDMADYQPQIIIVNE